MKNLSLKQCLFILEYLKSRDGKTAAVRAGYNPRTAVATAEKLLKDDRVSREVDALMAVTTAGMIAPLDECCIMMTDIARDHDETTANRLKAVERLSRLRGYDKLVDVKHDHADSGMDFRFKVINGKTNDKTEDKERTAD